MSKFRRRRSVYNTTTGTARAPVRWRFDLLTPTSGMSQAKRSVYIQTVSDFVAAAYLRHTGNRPDCTFGGEAGRMHPPHRLSPFQVDDRGQIINGTDGIYDVSIGARHNDRSGGDVCQFLLHAPNDSTSLRHSIPPNYAIYRDD